MSLARISILGCGWLGLPLARILVSEGYSVKGSTTSVEKIPVLEKAGISSFVVTVDDGVKGDKEFFASDILVLTLPFRRKLSDPKVYQRQIAAVAKEFKGHIVFTSSTSVYPDNIGSAEETREFQPDDERGKVLLGIEKDLLARSATVVRFAGLYGENRKIGAFLAGKKDIVDGPVNLIHQDDAVNILLQIIIKNVRGEILNACSDGHPTRKELYSLAAKNMGLPPPEFSDQTVPKTVKNDKLKRMLGYRFLHPDPMKDVIAS